MYSILDIKIPDNKKREINQKILHIVDSGQQHQQITPSVIFNTYSPLGAIHGLEFNNYDNFHQFQEAKKDVTFGQYFTPLQVAKFLCLMLKIPKEWKVADLTAGHGSLINFLQNPQENIYCNEWELKAYKLLKYLFPNINHSNKDIREYTTDVLMDCIIGNPPFSLTWKDKGNAYNSEVFYLLKSAELLKPASLCAVIVPESFLIDDFTDKGNINLINKHYNFVTQLVLPSNIFESVGAKITTKIMVFQKKSEHIKENPYINGQHNRIELESLDHKTATYFYNEYIKPLYEQKEKVKSKLILEVIQQGNENNSNFEYRVKKMLFDIKQGKNTKKHYNRAEAYLLKFRTQGKPHDMKFEDWVKIRITENKVIAYLKRILKEQHKKEGSNKVELVKDSYGLRLKSYNRKASESLKNMDIVKEMTFNDMLIKGVYPFNDNKYLKLFNKKRNEYKKQSTPFSEIAYNSKLAEWLDNFTITDKENNHQIKLNQIQKEDTLKMLSKNYGYLQWGTGAGKSISAIAQMLYRKHHNNIRNIFLVAPAIAINNNWNDILQSYDIDYTRIKSLKDINNIKQGQIVIMTFGMLTKYQKQIKKYVKMQSQRAMLVLDEADGICNPSSKRTKAVLDCFRRVSYKLLMSATSTRNNIPESFTAFELLYNNSINMLSKNETIYVEDKKTKEIKEQSNNNHMKPFPAYKKGHTHFKRSFSPEKATVFGVGKMNQDVYNSQDLSELINKTMITRTFEEVSGKDIYKIIQNTTKFNHSEKELYRIVIEEFYKLSHMYRSTGNSRKDSLLRIIQQLNSLLKACVTPNLFKGYYSNEMPSKAVKTLEMVGKWNTEQVVIGCTHVKTVNLYASYIRKKFPNRPLFIITGESTTLNKRKEIIQKLKETEDGILICTQQSLSSSMNIDFVNRVLLIELQWNFASIHQFFARFVRYTSTEQKEIHFLTIENSIESNLLKLIMNKEKLNNFMKNDSIEDQEILERFGVDFDILNMLLTKETDEEGKSYINWGSQKVV